MPGGVVFPGRRRLQKLLAKVDGGGCQPVRHEAEVFTKDVESPLKACAVPREIFGLG